MSASAARVMNIGGEVVADQGLPDLRVWPRVEIITMGFPLAWVRVLVRAALMSDSDVGSARRMWSCERWEAGTWSLMRVIRDVGSRTRAVTVCVRFRASRRVRRPVRPVLPIRRMWGRLLGVDILVGGWWLGGVLGAFVMMRNAWLCGSAV